jgi:hypothetical protein
MATTYKSKVSEDRWDVWHSNVNGDELLHTFRSEEEADYFLKTGEVGITPSMIEAWMGSDNLGADNFIDLLTDIINGDYDIDLFRRDVLEYHNES